ncbi:SDR family NAD(P)-dependent oxidoreductase [Nocardiopsis mangrovi]|uniref:SDR family NAD(P)-dependent oxidoreductase n=1 Tax=Nocardiopsis mangrovi TaxID=1179818 RepID=A0ABV9DVU6_9ACTN
MTGSSPTRAGDPERAGPARRGARAARTGNSSFAPSWGEPLAVIGMACRLPGATGSPASLWRLLTDGRDAIGEVPRDRWDAARHHDTEPGVPGRVASRAGGYIDDVGGFDAASFGITAAEATAMDPQQRVLLEVAWEALEHAGLPAGALEATRTGVFAGLSHIDYALRCAAVRAGDDAVQTYAPTGNSHAVAAGRISYLLGLNGPSLAVDTACSSGLTAVHLAAQSLRSGECDTAVAGAVSLILDPGVSISFSRWGMLSPTGRCRPFDADADGLVRSEGCGAVVLKRLGDALRDGDAVHALLRGSALNQDGRSNGLTAPSPLAQADVLRLGLAAAGSAPDDIGMIEAHGTGTPLGDPIEFGALASVYGAGGGDRRTALGSVKANLGHTESAAGIVGLIKAVLSVRHGVVPPTPHFRRWNPEIAAEGTGLFVPGEPVPWPAPGAARLAAVSSFGISGTNAHAVVESPPARRRTPPAAAAGGAPLVFPLSGGTPAAARATALRLAAWAETDGADVPLADIGHALARRRTHRPARIAVVAGDHAGLARRLRAAAGGDRDPAAGTAGGTAPVGAQRPPVWVFSGQGSQWAGMGAGLLRGEPAFAAAVDAIDPLVRAESGFSVREALAGGEAAVGIDRVQPTLFAFQVALAAAWRSHGVEPGAVVGHSMGEAAAAVVSGALTLADGVRVICRRSALLAALPGDGAMAAVELSGDEVERTLARAGAGPAVADGFPGGEVEPGIAGGGTGAVVADASPVEEGEGTVAGGATGVVVAVRNSPESTVVAGPPAEVDRLIGIWQDSGTPARRVAVDVASHSPAVAPLLDSITAALSEVRPRTPAVRCYGTVGPDPRAVPAFDAAYWADNLRRPVRFDSAVRALADDGHRVFVELAPHPLLTRAVEATAREAGRTVTALPSLRRDEDGPTALRARAGALHCAGSPVDWERAHPGGAHADLPPSAWDHRTFLLPPAEAGYGGAPGHPLLGAHTVLPDDHGRHVWNADIGTAELPWLADHRFNGVVFLPLAAYVEMAVTAARTVFAAGPADIEVTGLKLEAFLAVDEHTLLSTRADLDPVGDTAAFSVFAKEGTEWVRTASARLHHTTRRSALYPEPSDTARPDGNGAGADGNDARPGGNGAHADVDGTRPDRDSGRAGRDAALSDGNGVHAHGDGGGADGDGGRELTAEEFYRLLDRTPIGLGPLFRGVRGVRMPAGASSDTAAAEGRLAVAHAARAAGDTCTVHPLLLDACLQLFAAPLLDRTPDCRVGLPNAVGRIRPHGPIGTGAHCEVQGRRDPSGGVTGRFRLRSADGTPLLDADDVRIVVDTDDHPRLAERLHRVVWSETPSPSHADPTTGPAAAETGVCAAHLTDGTTTDTETAPAVGAAAGAAGSCSGEPSAPPPVARTVPAVLSADGAGDTAAPRMMTAADIEAGRAVGVAGHVADGTDAFPVEGAAAGGVPGRAAGVRRGAHSVPSVDARVVSAGRSGEGVGSVSVECSAPRVPVAADGVDGRVVGVVAHVADGTGTAPVEEVAGTPDGAAGVRPGRSSAPSADARVVSAALSVDGAGPRVADLAAAGAMEAVGVIGRVGCGERASGPLPEMTAASWAGALPVPGDPGTASATLPVHDGPASAGRPASGGGDAVSAGPGAGRASRAAGNALAGAVASPPGAWVVLAEAGALSASVIAARITGSGGAATTVALAADGVLPDTLPDILRDHPGHLRGIVVVAAPPRPVPDPRRARERVTTVLRLLRHLLAGDNGPLPRLVVVTTDACPVLPGDGSAADQAPLRALTRAAGHEHPELDIVHIDTDSATPPARVAEEILSAHADPDVALRAGRRYTARLRRAPLGPDERRRTRCAPGRSTVALRVRTPGDLASLEPAVSARRAPAPGEAEVRVHAAGLNYADVLQAMGVYPGTRPLGADAAGTVERVGAGVHGLAPGDRVALMADGALRGHVTVPVDAVIPLPADLDLTDAAALPCAYVTAWYALRHLARPRPGEAVLIHCATGGVGLAALHLARAAGARVLATAGSEAKRDLLRAMGVEHVMDSRTLGFAEQAREITGGAGVDVVLNCLTGRAQRAGMAALRVGGRFVEIGKRDLHSGAGIDPAPFRNNISFTGVDLARIAADRPDLLAELIAEVAAELAAGRLPALPVTARPLAEAADAFRTMAAAAHTGKLVLTLPDPDGPPDAVADPADVPVVRDGAYVITGGLGGIGLRLAAHLGGNGATRVVLNGRSAPGPAAAAVARLRAAGTDVRVVPGDIAAPGTAERLVAEAEADGVPLRGAAHAAAVIADGTVALLDDATLDRAWRAKAEGAWRLHQATADRDLDWWLAFSSAAALVAPPGQAGYAAANAWLDGLATWRRANGLPATSIAWGAWAGLGAGAHMARQGHTMITPDEGIAAVDRLLRHDRTCTGYLPADVDLWRTTMPHAVASPYFADLVGDGSGPAHAEAGTDTGFLERVRAAGVARAGELVTEHLAAQLRDILGVTARDIGGDARLTDLGVDSLRALELRTRVEQRLGVRVPAKLVWADGTLGGLADHVAAVLTKRGPR